MLERRCVFWGVSCASLKLVSCFLIMSEQTDLCSFALATIYDATTQIRAELNSPSSHHSAQVSYNESVCGSDQSKRLLKIFLVLRLDPEERMTICATW